jgi:hypothetical protein
MGNFYSHDFVVAFVTNATTGNMVLGNPFLQWEDAGDITVGVASLWGGTNESCSIGPGEVMPLPIRVPPTSRKFKISLGYSRDAGPLQKVFGPALRPVLSAVVGRLFARRNGPNQPLVQWLFDHGWLNGHLNLSYEGESEISGPAPSAPPDSR